MYTNAVNQIKHIGSRISGRRSSSKYEYFKSTNLIQTPKRLIDFLSPNLSKHIELSSDLVFQPLHVPFNSSLKEAGKILNTPFFHLHNDKIKNHDVIFFKKIIGDIKMNIQMHFLDDKLFYVHNEIRHNLIHSYEKNEQILRLMLERYHSGKLDNIEGRDIVLQDNESNYIYTSNQVCFGISYLSGDTTFYNQARRIAEEMDRKESRRMENQMQIIMANI